jgi:uncharacterized protein YidB (DUF937 family)
MSKKRGAPTGNLNRTKKLVWLEKYDLGSEAGIAEVLRQLIIQGWEGKIGTRQMSAITTALKLLLDEVVNAPMTRKLEEWYSTHRNDPVVRQ